MAESCCKLVGDLDLGIDGCVVSVSTSCNTDVAVVCGDTPLEGATIGSISISGYASTELWTGCASKAGVSIPFIRKYDCENNITYFIFSGQGQSYYTGDANRMVQLHNVMSTSCDSLSASSQSGPAAIYTISTQVNGYGMTYNGDPIPFTTTPKGTEIKLGGMFGDYTCYLQSFSLDLQPSTFPVASYSLVYAINGD